MKRLKIRGMNKRQIVELVRRVLIVICLVMIIVKPTISHEGTGRKVSNLNVWFVADATGSMIAKDVDNGNKRRYEMVQSDVSEAVSGLNGAKYSLIVQDFSSYSASPLTLNADAIVSALPYVKPKFSLYNAPTNLSDLLSYATKKVTDYKKRYPDRNNVLVFMSDGEDVSGKRLEVPSDLANVLDAAVVLGYGTREGSLIEAVGDTSSDESGDYFSVVSSENYIQYWGDDESIEVDMYNNVISKINEENLKSVADSLGGMYYHRESGNMPAEAINKMASAASYVDDADGAQANKGTELYWIFALILLVLLAWEGEELLVYVITERRNKNA